ncbi:MAG: pilin [Pedobacter sp.]|nr:pilin [Pedobacter sp.]
MKRSGGFSLMEMMVVLVILGILLSVAIPSYVVPLAKEQVDESLELVDKLKDRVESYYISQGKLPFKAEEAGLPPADKLLGNYLRGVEYQNGAFNLKFGNKAVPLLQDKVVTVRAIIVPGSPGSPMSWVCGYSPVPTGMQAGDHDHTTVPAKYLDVKCRDTSRK